MQHWEAIKWQDKSGVASRNKSPPPAGIAQGSPEINPIMPELKALGIVQGARTWVKMEIGRKNNKNNNYGTIIDLWLAGKNVWTCKINK